MTSLVRRPSFAAAAVGGDPDEENSFGTPQPRCRNLSRRNHGLNFRPKPLLHRLIRALHRHAGRSGQRRPGNEFELRTHNAKLVHREVREPSPSAGDPAYPIIAAARINKHGVADQGVLIPSALLLQPGCRLHRRTRPVHQIPIYSAPHGLSIPIGLYSPKTMFLRNTSPLWAYHTCGWNELFTMMLFSTTRP